jgi:hypothetical protein
VGQHAAPTRVKFRPGPSSTLGEKVASGLVWRFGTFDCISDNLACFKDGFGDSGSFLDIGSHRFYVAKPFPEEVTDVLDPLGDEGSSCSESINLGAMVEVMALGDEEGGDSPRLARPPLERLLPQEQNAPLPEQDASDISVVDLRTPLNMSSTLPGSPRPWSGRASFSSARWPRMRTSNAERAPCSASSTMRREAR